MNNITYSGALDLTELKHVELPADDVEQYSVRRGDLLFNRTNSQELVGKMAVWDRNEAYAFAGYLVRVRLQRERADPRFVAAWFNTPGMKAQLRTRAKPSINMSNINATELLTFPLVLPPLPEQRRIADILDRAEELRAKRRAALAKLDTLTQAIFIDLFGDPKANPKSWPVTPMADLFATSPIFGSMIPPESEERGWLSLRVGNIQDWNLDFSDQKYIDLSKEAIERHSVRDGDLLMARAIASREHLGKCVVVYPRGRKWAFDSHLMRIRFDPVKAEPEFIRHLLMTPGGRSLFLSASRKSTVQYNVNTKEISALRIPVPPLPLQQEFARRVAAVEQLRSAHRVSLAQLDALFASLQHRAFRGEL